MSGELNYKIVPLSKEKYIVLKLEGDIAVGAYEVNDDGGGNSGGLSCSCIGYRVHNHCKHGYWVFKLLNNSNNSLMKNMKTGISIPPNVKFVFNNLGLERKIAQDILANLLRAKQKVKK